MSEKSKSISMLVGAFAALIIAVSLIGVVVTEGAKVTELSLATQTLDINASKTGVGGTNINIPFTSTAFASALADNWRASIDGCSLASEIARASVGNGSDVFVLNTDYKISATNGSINFFSTDTVNNTISNITYVYTESCPTGYVYGWSNTTLKLSYGFMALAAMAVSLMLFYQVAKENGIINK